MNQLRISSVKELDELRREIQDSRDPDRPRITVCGGTGCSATGCKGVAGMLRVGLKSRELEGRVDLSVTGCHGFCECGPIVIVYPQGIFYQRVTPEDVDEIITETIEHGKPVERLLYRDPVTGEKKIHETDIPF